MASRTLNSKRNIIAGVAYRLIAILLPFINRTIIIRFLGAEYQGLGSLFSSILEVLNLTELGFSSAVVFCMYKMVAEADEDSICALLSYFRRVYKVIGLIIFGAGLCLIPFLQYLIKGSHPADINIYILFLVYLSQTCISYFLFGYKSAILSANQRLDITNKVQSVITVALCLSQMLALIITRNFYVYAVLSPVFTVLNNLTVAYITDKQYPQYRCRGSISEDMRLALRKQISGLMVNKISNAIRNSSGSIIISALFGLTLVTAYGNYYYIMYAIYSFMLTIVFAMSAGVGNSIVVETQEKNYKDLTKFTFIFAWISTFCTVCLFCIFQPFMKIWVGEELMLSKANMALFCAYFYVLNINNSINLYFDGNGLWQKAKALYISEAALNLVLNIVLGKLIGISGILISAVLTITVFSFLGRTRIIFNSYFTEYPAKDFYIAHLIYAAVTVVACLATGFVAEHAVRLSGIPGVILTGIICVVVSNLILFIAYMKLPAFKLSMSFVKSNILKRV